MTGGDRVTWWGPTAFDALEVGYGTSKLGAAIAPINPGFTEPEAASALEVPAPAPRRRASRLRRRGALGRRAAGALGARHDAGLERRGVDDGPAASSGSSEDASNVFLTSGSTGVSKGAVLSHRAAWLRAVPARRGGGRRRRRGTVVMFGLFHMAGWYFIEHAMAADRAVHLVRRADPDELLDAIERWRAGGLYCIPAVWQRILDVRRPLRHVVLVAEALTGTSLVTLDLIDALEGALPRLVDLGRLRIHRDGRGAVLLDSDLYATPAQRGQPPADGGGPSSPTTVSSGSAARPCSPATSTGPTPPPRPSTTTAGSTPATSRPATPTATSPSPAGLGVDPLRRRVGRPVEVETAILRTPRSPRSPWSASPTPPGARSCARRSSWRRGPRSPRSTTASMSPSTLVGPKQPRGGRQVDRAAPDRCHRPDPPPALRDEVIRRSESRD